MNLSNKVLSINGLKPSFGRWVLILCVIAFIPLQVVGQKTQSELEKEKKELEAKIAYTGVLLDETIKNKKASLNQLTTLKKQNIIIIWTLL